MEIKNIRQQLNLTQEALARELGVSVFTVQRWESSKTKPSVLARKALQDLLKKSGINPVPLPAEWATISETLLKQYPICQNCGKAPSVQVHHIIPRSFGGDHSPENLIAVCYACHAELEMMAKKKFQSKMDL